jgi:hypothetical protein
MVNSGGLLIQTANVDFYIFCMDPAPDGKSFSETPRKWEEFWGTMIALLTLTLPVTAIATYSFNSNVQPPAITVPAADK